MHPKKSLILCSVFVLLFGLASSACAQQDDAAAADEGDSAQAAGTMDTNREKASYAIGLNMGRNFSTQDVDVDLDAMIAGLRAGMAGADPALSDEDLQAAMQAFQSEVMAAQQEKRTKQAAENEAKGEAFLAENAQREGVQVTDSGLQYEVLEPGSGDSPTDSDTVQINYGAP